MITPPVPKFPDPIKHVSKKELTKEIRTTLVELARRMVAPGNRNKIIDFVACVHPDSRKDPARLPYSEKKARHKDKMECLFADIYNLLKSYWDFCEGGKIDAVKDHIAKIKQITQRNLSAYKIEGNDKDGYQLV